MRSWYGRCPVTRRSAPSLNSYFAIQFTQSDAVSFGVFQYLNLFIRNSFFIGFYRQDVGFIKAYLIIRSKGCKLLAVINFFPEYRGHGESGLAQGGLRFGNPARNRSAFSTPLDAMSIAI